MTKKRGNIGKTKKFNLIHEYKECLRYLQESKKFVYTIIGIFLLFLLIGFFIPAPEYIYNQIIKFIQEILAQTEGMTQFEMITFIISNNLRSTFFGIIFGFILGVFPLVSALANGYLLGFVSAATVNSGGFLTLGKLFLYGIFELPAVFISLGLGLKLGTFIFQKKKLAFFRNNLINSLKVFLLIVIPLLLIAGIIEGTLIVLNP